jgi:GEVED domain/Right handed beta helix region/SdrD B-like domain/Domain of unknown function DUF11
MSNYHRQVSRKSARTQGNSRQYINSLARSIALLGLITSGSPLWLLPAVAVPTAPNVTIDNQATGTFADLDDTSTGTQNVVSNTVTVTVGEVAGITVTANGVTGTPNPDATVYYSFVITNVGNDPTQFFIPSLGNITGNATQLSNIEITGYNLTGSAPVSIATPVVVPTGGGRTGSNGTIAGLLNGNNGTGIIQPGGSVTVRVPVTVNSNAAKNDTITVQLGDTPVDPASTATPQARLQNQAFIVGNNDVYTVDNPDSLETSAGVPINGDPTFHRQEASALQSISVIITSDYGDAPDTYGTDLTAGNSSNGTDPIGPKHKIDNITYLGSQVSVDDGIVLPPLYAGNTNYSIPISGITAHSTGNATLHAWIDFNNNGKFDPGEYAKVPIVNGQPSAFLSWTGITVASFGTSTYARFRISTDSTINANTPGGAAIDGEVEDYPIDIVSPPPSAASGNLSCMNLSTIKTNGSQYPFTYPLVPTGGATLPLSGVQISTTATGTNVFGAYAPPAAAGKSFVYRGTTIALQGNGSYLDILGNGSGVSRTIGVNFGATANSLTQANSTYEYVIGIAGLGGTVAPKEDGTVTSNVLLTKIGDIDVFNTGAYASLDGVANPPVGSAGTVVRTPVPSKSSGYTFYSIPTNVSTASFAIKDLKDLNPSQTVEQFGFVACVIEYVSAARSISGTVFEDINYGGGAGRSLVASSGSPRQFAIVELYNKVTGAFVATTTTDVNGKYNFANLAAGDYFVRVVNSTVKSSRGTGTGLAPVQTFRVDDSTGSITPDVNRVGGEKPSVADAGTGGIGAVLNLTTFAFTTAPTVVGAGNAAVGEQAESISVVKVSTGAVTGIDFGYNFDTIVNTNDSGQGSLRQFITNSNALTNVGLDQQGLTAVKETSIFMIPSGTTVPGILSTIPSQLTNGVAVINVTTELPQITDANTSIDGTTQTTNIGNNNASTFGTGGTVGVDNIPLSKVNKPEVELSDGGLGLAKGLQILADDATIRGISIWGFGKDTSQSEFYNQITVGNWTAITPARTLIEKNIIGTKATDFSVTGSPGRGSTTGSLNTGSGIYVLASNDATIQNNLIGFNGGTGVIVFGGLANGQPGFNNNITVSGNEIRGNGVNNTRDGIALESGTKNSKAINNLIIDTAANGVSLYKNGANSKILIENNTIQNSGQGYWEEAGIAAFETAGGNDNISKNIITGSKGAGIWLEQTVNTTKITQNSIYNNGGLGIDLKGATLDTGTGTQNVVNNTVTPNDGSKIVANIANVGIDYPIITSSTLSGTTLTVKGYVGNVATGSTTFANTTLEFFIGATDTNDKGRVFSSDPATVAKLHAEGKTYLGSCTADANGLFGNTGNLCTFVNAGTLGLTDPKNITATATDTAGNTSEFSSVPTSKANVLMVKRITAIKDGVTGVVTPYNSFVDDTTSTTQTNDNDCNWKGATGSTGNCTNPYTVGAINAGKVKSGDEIEYTIYYLNAGANKATPVKICDNLDPNLTFQPDFNANPGKGIEWSSGISASQYLTNSISDNDPGKLTNTASTANLATDCNLPANTSTTNDVVVVDVANTANPLAGSTAAGTPPNSYGYIRFKVKVK